jgi:two-component system, LytTR family, response regulator LytT
MNVVIIEDELQTARLLKSMLEQQHGIQVLAIITSIEQGIPFFEQQRDIDLVFSDIEIADGLCFDLFKEVMVDCPVIFCTAFNQYTMEAFKTNGIDYLLKPFTQKSIADAIQKYRKLTRRHSPPANQELVNMLKTALTQRTTVLVNFRNKTFPINVSAIAFFYVENDLTTLYTEGKSYTVLKSLDELADMLDNNQFFRANRQYIINRDYIKEVEKFFARKLVLKLTVPTPDTVVVSKAKATEFMKWLEQSSL